MVGLLIGRKARRVSKSIAVLFLAVVASGCEAVPGTPTNRMTSGLARLMAGNGGYTGEVRPITTPLTLEYGEVADATVTMGAVARVERGSEVKENWFDATMKVTTRQASQNTIIDMRIVEYRDARGTAAPRLPIVQVLALASRAGELRDLTVSFPFAKETRRPEPAKDSEEYKEFLRVVRASYIPFSRQIQKAGDPIYTIDLPEMIARSMGIELTERDRRNMRWTGGVTALGLTTVDKRLSVLARVDGRMTGSDGEGRDLEIVSEGYYALDLVTGLPNDGLVRNRLEIKSGGLRQGAIDAILTVKTTY